MMKQKIALTGSIGSGKSFVCRILEQHGIEIYDCDMAAKRIMASSQAVRNALIELIGSDAYINAKPNKAVIAKYILSSKDNARNVNAIVHPAVGDDFVSSGLSWMECAILFSSGFNRYVDKVVCVTAPYEVRVQRIMARDKISRAKAEEWINCQMSQDEVAEKSDFIINNDEVEPLEPQILRLLSDVNKQ